MLASFFYQPEVPSSNEVLDMARKALVASASSGSNDLDPETAQDLLDGLAKVYEAAVRHEHRAEDDFGMPRFDDAEHAERAYLKRAQGIYAATVGRAFPNYEAADGSIWWPEGLRLRAGYVRSFIYGLAKVMGEIEGDRTVAMFRHMQRLDAEQKGVQA